MQKERVVVAVVGSQTRLCWVLSDPIEGIFHLHDALWSGLYDDAARRSSIRFEFLFDSKFYYVATTHIYNTCNNELRVYPPI
jgi:hypothetical protein